MDPEANDPVAENLVAQVEAWTAEVEVAGNEVAELESNEADHLESNQSVIRTCWLQIGFFAAIINGIAVLITGGTRVPASLPCWTVSLVVPLTAGLLFGITIPIGFGFRKIKEFKRDSEKYTVSRSNLKTRTRDLISRGENLKAQADLTNHQVIKDQIAALSPTVDKLREVRDGDLVAQYNHSMFKKNLIVVTLFGLLYVLFFPVGSSFMLCGGLRNNVIKLIEGGSAGSLPQLASLSSNTIMHHKMLFSVPEQLQPTNRATEVKVLEPTSSHRTAAEPRITVQTTSEVDLLGDGMTRKRNGADSSSGEHNHQLPQSKIRAKDASNELGSEGPFGASHQQAQAIVQTAEANSQIHFQAKYPSAAPAALHTSNTIMHRKMLSSVPEQPQSNNCATEVRVLEPTSSHRTAAEPWIIVQTTSEVDLFVDV